MGKKNRTQSRILNSFNYMFLMALVIVLVCSVCFISFHTKLQSLNAVIAIPLVILPVLFFSSKITDYKCSTNNSYFFSSNIFCSDD